MISPPFIFFFRYYVYLLFYRRFRRVWLDQNYKPDAGRSTLYFLNHNSWWDGLIPLLLNDFKFRQRGRAVMDEVQFNNYPFFKRIGAYSIDRSNPRKARETLLYTVKLLNQKGTSVYLYPQGSISDSSTMITFENGISWLYDHCKETDFVPIALHQHTMFSDKPELYIKTGVPVRPGDDLSRKDKTRIFENSLDDLLTQLRQEAARQNPAFEKLI